VFGSLYWLLRVILESWRFGLLAFYLPIKHAIWNPLSPILSYIFSPFLRLLSPALAYLNQQKFLWLRNLLLSIAACCLLFVSAVVVYILCYWALVPKFSTEAPLHFQYPAKDGVSSRMPMSPDLPPDHQSWWWANQDQTHSKEHWASNYNYPDIPVADTNFDYNFFRKGHPYDVSVQLELPESPQNGKLGVFMVTAEVFTRDNSSIKASKPAMIRYKSNLLKWMITCVYALPLIFGFTEEKQFLVIPVIEKINSPFSRVTVSLSKPIELYGASVTVHARLTGIQWLVHTYFYSSAIMGITGIFLMEILGLLVAYAFNSWVVSLPSPPETGEREGEGEEEEEVPKENQQEEEEYISGTEEDDDSSKTSATVRIPNGDRKQSPTTGSSFKYPLMEEEDDYEDTQNHPPVDDQDPLESEQSKATVVEQPAEAQIQSTTASKSEGSEQSEKPPPPVDSDNFKVGKQEQDSDAEEKKVGEDEDDKDMADAEEGSVNLFI